MRVVVKVPLEYLKRQQKEAIIHFQTTLNDFFTERQEQNIRGTSLAGFFQTVAFEVS